MATRGLGMLASETPLHAAARNGRTEVATALLKAGAHPTSEDDDDVSDAARARGRAKELKRQLSHSTI